MRPKLESLVAIGGLLAALSVACAFAVADEEVNRGASGRRASSASEQLAAATNLPSRTHSNLVGALRDRGLPREEIVGIEERLAARNAGVRVVTWQDWTNQYRAVILDPPIQFDAWEAQPADYTTPVAAFRAFEHAVFAGQTERLLARADASGKDWLRQHLRVDAAEPRRSYATMTNRSVFTVLLTATDWVGDQEYALVLARLQARTDPRSERVSFIVQCFRREGREYLLTGDYSVFGVFGGVRTFANANDGNMELYPTFHEKMQRSAFPPHFYTIGD